MKSSNIILASFLRKLADGIERKTLTDKQVWQIGQFLMSFIFQSENKLQTEDEEFMKFLTLGWWVYKMVIPTLEE